MCFSKKNKSDSLENILINEITHIQTRCNHGNPIYDNKHKENIQKYYQKELIQSLGNILLSKYLNT